MIIRRVVFGEPKPGGPKFAGLLAAGLAENVVYCNRAGVLLHDRVTDLPYSFPDLGLDLIHTAPMSFVNGPADPNDQGTFIYHHIQLYQKGALVARPQIDPVHLESLRLCRALYAYAGDPAEKWDHQGTTAGVVWAIKIEGARVYVVHRGSQSFLDWLRDATIIDPRLMIQHSAFGPMWGGFVIGMQDTWDEIRPLIAQASEAVFTGHSLGAARAGITAAYAVGAPA